MDVRTSKITPDVFKPIQVAVQLQSAAEVEAFDLLLGTLLRKRPRTDRARLAISMAQDIRGALHEERKA